MTIYTRTGDSGETGLFGGGRVAKYAPRIEALGTIDELNVALGLARAETLPAEIDRVLLRLQSELMDLGMELATPAPVAPERRTIGPGHVAAMETDIDRFEAALPPLKQLILPSGNRAAVALHMARAVCRRGERRVVTAIRQGPDGIAPVLSTYLNRLSDLLFVLARSANAEGGEPETPWQPPE